MWVKIPVVRNTKMPDALVSCTRSLVSGHVIPGHLDSMTVREGNVYQLQVLFHTRLKHYLHKQEM